MMLGSGSDDRKNIFFPPRLERVASEPDDRLHRCDLQRRLADHSPSPAIGPLASINARTASCSTSLRFGCQTSKMKTTRNSSDGFSASCSIVSSNTKASPGSQYRVSAPTLNQQPSGTISGKWHTSRELFTPTCAGMCAFGASNENIALGPAPAMTGC